MQLNTTYHADHRSTSPLVYEECLRKTPRQQRSKVCVNHIYLSALLLLDTSGINQLTVEAVSMKSGHSGSTISEWFDLNNKELFAACAARHHMHGLISMMKLSSIGLTNTSISSFIDRILSIWLPSEIGAQVLLYQAWSNLEASNQQQTLKEINSHLGGSLIRMSSADKCAGTSITYSYLVSAIWGVCTAFNDGVHKDQSTLSGRRHATELIKDLVDGLEKKNTQPQREAG